MGVVFDEVVAEVEAPDATAAPVEDAQSAPQRRTERAELRHFRALDALDARRRARLEAD